MSRGAKERLALTRTRTSSPHLSLQTLILTLTLTSTLALALALILTLSQELILLAMRAAPGERPSACVVLSHPWLVAGGEGVGGVGGVDDETLCRRLSVECLAAALPPL